MAGARLSRRKIAAYFADELIAGRDVTKPLAAYLVETKRTREAILVIREIESALAERGVLLADIASSRTLVDDTKDTITNYLKDVTGAKTVHLRSEVDESLLGGVDRNTRTAARQHDTTQNQPINSKQDIRN